MRRVQLPESPTACAALALLLLMPIPSAAQDVTEPALKAAFIYNFAKFTEWPADVMTTAEPLLLCVLGDAAIGDALERAVRAARWPATAWRCRGRSPPGRREQRATSCTSPA